MGECCINIDKKGGRINDFVGGTQKSASLELFMCKLDRVLKALKAIWG